MALMRAITTSTSTPERRAISSNGSGTNPSILSSEIARIFALIGSLCSTGGIRIMCHTHLGCDRHFVGREGVVAQGSCLCSENSPAGSRCHLPVRLRHHANDHRVKILDEFA